MRKESRSSAVLRRTWHQKLWIRQSIADLQQTSGLSASYFSPFWVDVSPIAAPLIKSFTARSRELTTNFLKRCIIRYLGQLSTSSHPFSALMLTRDPQRSKFWTIRGSMAFPSLKYLFAKTWSHLRISVPTPRSRTKRRKFKLNKMVQIITRTSNNTNSNNSSRFVLRAVALMLCGAMPTSGLT